MMEGAPGQCDTVTRLGAAHYDGGGGHQVRVTQLQGWELPIMMEEGGTRSD